MKYNRDLITERAPPLPLALYLQRVRSDLTMVVKAPLRRIRLIKAIGQSERAPPRAKVDVGTEENSTQKRVRLEPIIGSLSVKKLE